MNKIGNMGMDFLGDALSVNTSLEYLDLFDVDFSNEGCAYLDQALKTNKALVSLKLANTHVSSDLSDQLMGTIIKA